MRVEGCLDFLCVQGHAGYTWWLEPLVPAAGQQTWPGDKDASVSELGAPGGRLESGSAVRQPLGFGWFCHVFEVVTTDTLLTF